MNRRGFIAAAFAAPIALLGNFIRNHNKVTYSTGSIKWSESSNWVLLVSSQPSPTKTVLNIKASCDGGKTWREMSTVHCEGSKGVYSVTMPKELYGLESVVNNALWSKDHV